MCVCACFTFCRVFFLLFDFRIWTSVLCFNLFEIPKVFLNFFSTFIFGKAIQPILAANSKLYRNIQCFFYRNIQKSCINCSNHPTSLMNPKKKTQCLNIPSNIYFILRYCEMCSKNSFGPDPFWWVYTIQNNYTNFTYYLTFALFCVLLISVIVEWS